LSLFMTGADTISSWNSNEKKTDFYTMKGWVERILSKAGMSTYQVKELGTEDKETFSEGLEYHRGPNSIVRFGQVSRTATKTIDISVPVFYAEFNYKSVAKSAGKSSIQVQGISKYPSTERDLSLVIDNKVTFEEILRITNKTEKKLIKEISLFDVYKNAEQLGEDKKAYAVKFLFQDATKTLKDKEIEKVMNKLIDNFKSKLGAQIRS